MVALIICMSNYTTLGSIMTFYFYLNGSLLVAGLYLSLSVLISDCPISSTFFAVLYSLSYTKSTNVTSLSCSLFLCVTTT